MRVAETYHSALEGSNQLRRGLQGVSWLLCDARFARCDYSHHCAPEILLAIDAQRYRADP
jgi:hypothetical protein